MIEEEIRAITDALEGYDLGEWARMPDLELYMDQVITYLKRQLELFQEASGATLITPSIINNYVKGGVVPRPVNKRYTKPQLAALMMVCILKRVLPIESVKRLVAPHGDAVDEARYADFCKELKGVLSDEAELFGRIGKENDLERLAMCFAMRASVDCLIADRLIARINEKKQ